MATVAFAIVVAFALAASGQTPADDLKALQGRWAEAEIEFDGKRAEKGFLLTISGSTLFMYTPYSPGKIVQAIEIDPTKTPKTIDFKEIIGPRKGETYKGIYKIESDRIVYCTQNLTFLRRPDEFRSIVSNADWWTVTTLKKSKKP